MFWFIPFPFLLFIPFPFPPFPPALRTRSHPAPARGLETEGWVCGANEEGSVSSSVQWVLQTQRMSKCLRTVGALGTRLYLLPSQLCSSPRPLGGGPDPVHLRTGVLPTDPGSPPTHLFIHTCTPSVIFF